MGGSRSETSKSTHHEFPFRGIVIGGREASKRPASCRPSQPLARPRRSSLSRLSLQPCSPTTPCSTTLCSALKMATSLPCSRHSSTLTRSEMVTSCAAFPEPSRASSRARRHKHSTHNTQPIGQLIEYVRVCGLRAAYYGKVFFPASSVQGARTIRSPNTDCCAHFVLGSPARFEHALFSRAHTLG